MKNHKNISTDGSGISFPRADPAALALFDESTKRCHMQCGRHSNDPRTWKECLFLCTDCSVEVRPLLAEGRNEGINNQTDTYRDQWYETYYSIIYTPTGEVPQTKGPWTDIGPVEEMLTFLTGEYPGGDELLVVESRCGHIDVTPASFWSEMNKVHAECAEEEAAYIKAGICSACGACSLKEAETKCRPTPIGDTGDYSCDGERLWEGQER